MPSTILAIDAGGTAVKVALYDRDGRERAVAGETFQPLTPAPGQAERDPEAMWQAVCRSIRKVLYGAAVEAADIAVVGLTGYGNGLILVDEDGNPVRPAILAPDQRAASIVETWRDAGLEADHLALTYQRLWAGKPLPLLKWMERHEPDALARAAHMFLCKDYLRLRLTGAINLEVSDASTSSLLDHGGRAFTPTVLERFGLAAHAHLFAPILEPLSIAAQISERAAAETGLRPDTPVSAGYADGPAMLLALGIVDETLLNVVAGTWGLNQLVTRTPITNGSILASSLGPRQGEYILVDGGATSASAFEWFIETMRPGVGCDHAARYAWCNEAVAKLDPDDPPVYFLPYLNGRLDAPEARGTFIGLSAWHRLPHMARAVFEGVAMEHRGHVEALLAGRARPRAARFAGGAARSRPWLEIFAATLRMPIEVSAANELGALGAAIIAAVGAGLHPDLETAAARMTGVRATIEPDPALMDGMNRRYDGYRALRDALGPVWHRLDAGR